MIISEFDIYGQKIKTKIANVELNSENLLGSADYVENIIRLATKAGTRDVSQDSLEQTYYHEFVHVLLEKSGWQRKLFKDNHEDKELFVEIISALLHQALKTAKYEPLQ